MLLHLVLDAANGSRAGNLLAGVLGRLSPLLAAVGIDVHVLTNSSLPANRWRVRDRFATTVSRERLREAHDSMFRYVEHMLPVSYPGRSAAGSILGELESLAPIFLYVQALLCSSKSPVWVFTPVRSRKRALLAGIAATGTRNATVIALPRGDVSPDILRSLSHAVGDGEIPEWTHARCLLVAESSAMQQTLQPVHAKLRAEGIATDAVLLNQAECRPLMSALLRSAATRPSTDLSMQAPQVIRGEDAAVFAMASLVFEASRAIVDEWARVELAAQELLKDCHTRLMVLGNDRSSLGSALCLAARRNGIATLAVQDGVAGDMPHWWMRNAEWSAANGQQLIEIRQRVYGMCQTEVVCGQPRYDGALELAKNPQGAASLQRLKQSTVSPADERPLVVIALQPRHGASYVQALFAGVATARRKLNFRLVVRPHPSHDRDDLLSLLPDQMHPFTEIRSDHHLPTLLASANVIVGEFSTMLIEAVVHGASVVAFEADELPPPLALSEHGIAIRARSVPELTSALERLLQPAGAHANAQKALDAAEYLLGPLDGHSAARVAKLANRALATGDSVNAFWKSLR